MTIDNEIFNKLIKELGREIDFDKEETKEIREIVTEGGIIFERFLKLVSKERKSENKVNVEVAKILFDYGAVHFINKPYIFSSGVFSPIYIDNRILISFPSARNIIIDIFLKIINESKFKPEVIAGIESSGIPWASWIADRLNLPLIYIRKKRKDYGTQNLIEGCIKKDEKKVILIEDLISTGDSLIHGVRALRERYYDIILVLSLFSYEFKKSIEKLEKENVLLFSLTDLSTIIKVNSKMNYFSPQTIIDLRKWKEDPYNYYKEETIGD